MGRTIERFQYGEKKFINFGYSDTDKAKAAFRTFRLSEQQVKCVLNNAAHLRSLMNAHSSNCDNCLNYAE